jgi:endonuclease/exonuclease/phosphatase family metal-dependent hydrolase
MKLLSWNLAGRLRRIPPQVEMLASRTPDLVALQEVTQPGRLLLRTLLAKGGLIHQADSFELAPCPTILTGPRRYGLLIASRFPIGISLLTVGGLARREQCRRRSSRRRGVPPPANERLEGRLCQLSINAPASSVCRSSSQP